MCKAKIFEQINAAYLSHVENLIAWKNNFKNKFHIIDCEKWTTRKT